MHGTHAKWSRRQVLGSVSAGLVGALATSALPAAGAQPVRQAPGLVVRRNIYMLDPAGPEIASLRRGVDAMKQLSITNPDDPRGWQFQANMHGAPLGVREDPYWRQCQHGSFFFLPWHRMYLYWFQRILQWASGDPTLALPYWDYSLPEWRILPQAFRVPADPSNPLYLDERDPLVNAGVPPWSILGPSFDHRWALSATRFFHTDELDSSFGGAWAPGPVHSSDRAGSAGQLEMTPHGHLHVLIGGSFEAPDGSFYSAPMGDPDRAAIDPIFWLHHANIERLWKRWLDLGEGRANPTYDATWMSTPFTFFDERAREVQMTASEILSTEQLGYVYDDDPLVLGGGADPMGGGLGEASGGGPGTPGGAVRWRRRSLLGASRAGRTIELGSDLITVPIRRGDEPDVDELAIPSAGSGDRIVLSIERLQGTGVPGVAFEVYLHSALDRGSVPSADSLVGILSLFGLQPNDASGHGNGTPMGTQGFDVTDRVLAAMNDPGRMGRLAATFVPQVLASTPPPGGVLALAERVALTIG